VANASTKGSPFHESVVISAWAMTLLACANEPPTLDATSATSGESTGAATESPATTAVDSSGDGDACAGCPGACLDGACCPATRVCEGTCCDFGDVCSWGECVAPGQPCVNAAECDAGEYCDTTLVEPVGAGLMCPGQMVHLGLCVPTLPDCADGREPLAGEVPTCLPTCEVPPSDAFQPTLLAQWMPPRGHAIAAPPIVVPLRDDNCDGLTNEQDHPDIILTTYDVSPTSGGTLRSLSWIDGEWVENWTTPPDAIGIHPQRPLAAADLDGAPGAEIVACTPGAAGSPNRVRAFHGDGTPWWESDVDNFCYALTIADLDGDGTAEVIGGGGVLDGATGALRLAAPLDLGREVVAVDLDGDGVLDVVGGRGAYALDGTVLADTGIPHAYVAVADLEGDGVPEVVGVRHQDGGVDIWRYDPSVEGGAVIVRSNIAVAANCNANAGGAPAIADANFDGIADIAVAGGDRLDVIDGVRALDTRIAPGATYLWRATISDCASGSTAVVMYDHDGDGRSDVFHLDDTSVRAHDGASGDVYWQICADGTRRDESPVFADIDLDGETELLVVANGTSTCFDGSVATGLRVFEGSTPGWARTRRIWNQHAYQTTFVADDATVATPASPHWATAATNDFRRAAHPGGAFSAPDLVGRVLSDCSGGTPRAVARIRNLGRAPVPAGVEVEVYEGDPDAGGVLRATVLTTQELYPAQAEDLVVELVPPAAEEVVLVIDPAFGSHAWQECRLDNNRVSGPVSCP
jgi:hypothetical protein